MNRCRPMPVGSLQAGSREAEWFRLAPGAPGCGLWCGWRPPDEVVPIASMNQDRDPATASNRQ
jgi:hypothetical protein